MRSKSAVLAGALLAAACGGNGGQGGATAAIEVDGSSTVYPITEAMAEEYMIETQGSVRVTVGVSGTGGGFKRFCAGETAISNASRPIKDSERAACEQNGVEFLELPVAYDGIAVVTNPQNPVQCLTVEELRTIWQPASTVQNWSQVRQGFPDMRIRLYGPGTDSGTFDYFTEAIMGEEDSSRPDYTASEDDNVLVQGVVGDRGSLGYFGYAYYEENAQNVKALGVDAGSGCVTPNPETIESGTYAPLSRPVFIYVSRQALARPEVAEFVRFYVENAAAIVPEVGYVPLDEGEYARTLQQLEPGSGGNV